MLIFLTIVYIVRKFSKSNESDVTDKMHALSQADSQIDSQILNSAHGHS